MSAEHWDDDFQEARAATEELMKTMSIKPKRTAKKSKVEKSASQPRGEAEKTVREMLGNVVDSPLRPGEGGGYGYIGQQATKPARLLYDELQHVIHRRQTRQALAGVEAVQEAHRYDDTKVRDALHGFVSTLCPDHPWLQATASSDESEDDEERPLDDEGEGQGVRRSTRKTVIKMGNYRLGNNDDEDDEDDEDLFMSEGEVGEEGDDEGVAAEDDDEEVIVKDEPLSDD